MPMSAIAARAPLIVKSPVRPAEVTAAEPDAAATGSTYVAQAASDADQAIIAMYTKEYRSLVRMSAVLGGDGCTAQGVGEEWFLAQYGAGGPPRGGDQGGHFPRPSLGGRARSGLR